MISYSITPAPSTPTFTATTDGKLYCRTAQGGVRRVRALDLALRAEAVRSLAVMIESED